MQYISIKRSISGVVYSWLMEIIIIPLYVWIGALDYIGRYVEYKLWIHARWVFLSYFKFKNYPSKVSPAEVWKNIYSQSWMIQNMCGFSIFFADETLSDVNVGFWRGVVLCTRVSLINSSHCADIREEISWCLMVLYLSSFFFFLPQVICSTNFLNLPVFKYFFDEIFKF